MGVEYEKYCRDLRKIMLLMLSNGKSGHIGGSLSVLESLAFVYREFIKGSKNKLVYSKGHCELAIYSILFKEGIIQKYWIDKLKKFGSVLQGHPSCSWISELDYSAGSLGQGLSFGIGMAISGKEKNYDVFVVLGDGELQEGQIWEGIMLAPRLKLGNLNVLVDYNGLQLEEKLLVLNNCEYTASAWEKMGWNVQIVEDGNDIENIRSCFLKEKNPEIPNAYLMKTIKGKGIKAMENKAEYHSVVLSPREISKIIRELEIN